MPNLKRLNHYLPVCYQRGFANSAGQVWVRFSDKPKPEPRKPTTVGFKRSFYIIEENGGETDRVEDFFNKTVETPFARLSRRISEQQDELSTISGFELGVLARFVASQAVRTAAHKKCVEEQARSPVSSTVFVRVMARLSWTILNNWINSNPNFHFYTSLPHVADRFITGDHPVVVMVQNENMVWQPRDDPQRAIRKLEDILNDPGYAFHLPLSPYIAVCIHGKGGRCALPPRQVDPLEVRALNDKIRGQSEFFTLARDPESLT